jgi:hypothetical protein
MDPNLEASPPRARALPCFSALQYDVDHETDTKAVGCPVISSTVG